MYAWIFYPFGCFCERGFFSSFSFRQFAGGVEKCTRFCLFILSSATVLNSFISFIFCCCCCWTLLLLSHFSRVQRCATPQTAAHQAAVPGTLQAGTLGFSKCKVVSSAKTVLLLPFQFGYFLFFSWLTALSSISNIMLAKWWEWASLFCFWF